MRSTLAFVAGAMALAGCWSAATTLRAERSLLDGGAGDEAGPPTSDGAAAVVHQDGATDAMGLEDVAGDGGAEACALVQHTDGLGQMFTDCVPLGTYDQQLAEDACRAFTGAACNPNVVCPASLPDGGLGGTVAMVGTSAAHVTGSWGYSGPGAGHVSTTAPCPTYSDPTYK